MSKQEIKIICKKFKKQMQKLVDNNKSGVTKLSISIGNEPPIVIAEKKAADEQT